MPVAGTLCFTPLRRASSRGTKPNPEPPIPVAPTGFPSYMGDWRWELENTALTDIAKNTSWAHYPKIQTTPRRLEIVALTHQ